MKEIKSKEKIKMSIRFDKEKNIFLLTTKNTAYAFEIYGGKYLRHLYYGKKTRNIDSLPQRYFSFSPYPEDLGEKYSPDLFSSEYAFWGTGDFRTPSLRLKGADGTGVTDFTYSSYRIFRGRHDLDGIPSARADEKTRTLEITMKDSVTSSVLKLCYTVFSDSDVISRYIILTNKGKADISIEKCMSLTLDLERSDLDMVSFWGTHLHECTYERAPLTHGLRSITSRRGATSHHYNPFFALCSHKASEGFGDVYAFNFVYSGSFLCEVEVDQQCHTRVSVGLGSENFGYTLSKGESFISPEAIMSYSNTGFDKLTNNLHNFTRSHILPERAILEPHPIVLNTWEGCVFNINRQLLLDFADEAVKLGFDMVVMDDGWFGQRTSDRAGLGDWYENRERFPEGLGELVRSVKAKGIKFGIWIEPEMVNPDSELYRAHPDWCLHIPSRSPALSRNQLVLDMSRPEVIEYLKNSFKETFRDIPLDYFKWDMNRHLSDVGSAALPPEKQNEVYFRYMKGVYSLLDWFVSEYPDAVIETCSGGGGRYDLAMMTYGIQIWTSDNTNPYDRTNIQASALMAYPAATMSCHVSDPKGSLRSLDYRYKVAVAGMLGYEFDIMKMSEEIKKVIAKQIKEYRRFERLMRRGNYHSVASPTKNDYSAYYYINGDRNEILLTLIEKKGCKKGETRRLKIKDAIPGVTYTDKYSGVSFSGDDLRRGITLPLSGEDDSAYLFYLK